MRDKLQLNKLDTEKIDYDNGYLNKDLVEELINLCKDEKYFKTPLFHTVYNQMYLGVPPTQIIKMLFDYVQPIIDQNIDLKMKSIEPIMVQLDENQLNQLTKLIKKT